MNDDRPLYVRVLATVLLVIVLVICSPVLLPLLIFELTPYRRNQILSFQLAILDVLRRLGETDGRSLRAHANKQAGTKIGRATFYNLMSRFVDEGAVTICKEARELYGQQIQTTLYTLTPRGRHKKVVLETQIETVRRVIGPLVPSPA